MKRSILILIAAALVLGACGATAGSTQPTARPPEVKPSDTPAAPPVEARPTDTVSPPSGMGLTGTNWKLVSFGAPGAETAVAPGSVVTLAFQSDTQLGGKGGCNSYGADYKAEGGTLAVGSVISTMMACADDQVMQQEQQYFQALQAAGSFELSADDLVIHYNNDQGVLTFQKSVGTE